MAEKAKIDLSISAGDAINTLGGLEERAEALTKALKGTQIGTEQYKKLNAELIKTTGKVKDLELGFESLDAEQKAGQIGAVAGAVGDMTSAMILLGGESETMQQVAENIELALGVSMAFKGAIEGSQAAIKLYNDAIARGSKSMLFFQSAVKKVSAALAKTPWFVIAAAIIAVAVAIRELTGEMSGAEKAQENLTAAMKEGNKAVAEESTQIEKEIAIMKSSNVTMKSREEALERLNEILPESIGLITKETIATGEATAAIQKHLDGIRKRAEARALENLLTEDATELLNNQMAVDEMRERGIGGQVLAAAEEKLAIAQEEHDLTLQMIVNRTEEETSIEGVVAAKKKDVETTVEGIEANRAKIKTIEDEADAAEDTTQRRIDAQKELDLIEINAIKDKVEKKKALATFAFEQEIAALDENITEENELIVSKTLSLQEELIAIELEAFEEKIVRELDQEFQELEKLKEFEAAKLQVQKEAQQKLDDAKAKSVAQAKKGAQDLFNVAQKLFKDQNNRDIKAAEEKLARGEKLTAKETKRLERQDKIQKAFALAQIAIDTAKGVSGAIAAGSGLIFPANLGAIATGVAAVLAGIAQAAALLGESPNIPSIPEVAANVESSDSTQNVPDFDEIAFGSTLLNQQPGQVVVVESITDGINNVDVIESQATFG